MRVALCTLVLNEMEWLPRLYEQHRGWPGLVRWVFVEAADREFARVNPGLVTEGGLSTDGTTGYLKSLSHDPLVTVCHHGWTGRADGKDPSQGKCEARSTGLRLLEGLPDDPDLLVVLDADEFWPYASQERLAPYVRGLSAAYTGFAFRHREVWRPPLYRGDPLFSREVRGGFWAIPYCRVWRWELGLRYAKTHNTPQTAAGALLDRSLYRGEGDPKAPEYVHLGFAADPRRRVAKHRYYEGRGEAKDKHREWYCRSRGAWETWTEGDRLPRGAEVVPYAGPVPECFR